MRPVVILGLVIVGLIAAFSGCNSYNGFVSKDTAVEQAWGNVQSAYQRRADLVPNLVATVKGAANFEQSTLTGVAEARSKATSIQVDPTNLTPEKMAEFQQAQSGLSQALGKLLMITENYPELRATESFKELQSQLEGTENRIKVERDKFNGVVADYNNSVRRFPANFWAGIFGFDRKTPFEADQGAQNVPKVEF
ncbi:MAG: LemA family protein [Saprospiraceae bacterium]|nr:LemA family protein [Saprospiraceae bacterium]MCF8251199.1 LemA family protein [Saprospiraceae bacterium]MCF8282368.1 LemA family protein [Bacteroidales bacterium]MCF8313011.1 LemA family protein [Saprospiraceae bacterium]MCF8441458.1 LemA family protein [Saprospiraceae bacterium]